MGNKEKLKTQPTWQPIETIPKDGTRVLISDGKHVGHAYFKYPNFYIVASNNRVNDSDITHWMPLPKPPQGSNE